MGAAPGRPRRSRSSPTTLRREIAAGAAAGARASREGAAAAARPSRDGAEDGAPPNGPPARSLPSASPSCRRCSPTCSTACGDEREAEIPAADLVERFHIPPEELEEHLSLLNLVNFGGGCYAVYAELHDDTVHVDKELFGDTFRAPPRLTPLEARAIRLALEFVGPMIAADARTPLERVRAKLEETFGEFELAQTPEPHVRRAEEDLVATLSRGIRERRLVEVEYLKEGEDEVSTHLVEPYSLERRLPLLVRPHVGPRRATASARSGSTGCAARGSSAAASSRARASTRTSFRDAARPAKIWYSQADRALGGREGRAPARRRRRAVAERPVGSPEWLVGEILSFRGEAVVLEPAELRRAVAKRARELQRELGVARVRV